MSKNMRCTAADGNFPKDDLSSFFKSYDPANQLTSEPDEQHDVTNLLALISDLGGGSIPMDQNILRPANRITQSINEISHSEQTLPSTIKAPVCKKAPSCKKATSSSTKETYGKTKKTRKFTAQYIFGKIFASSPDKDLFFNGSPSPPKGKTSGIYLVDNNKYTFDDILADDNGVYTYEGSPTNHVYFENGYCYTAHKNENENGYFIKRRTGKRYVDEFVNRDNVYVLYRTYRRHTFYKGFTNVVCRIKNVDGVSLRYCLVIYEWESGEEESNFTVPCHGNAKTEIMKETPFLRTEKRIINTMKDNLKNGERPQDIYINNIESSGGPMNGTSVSSFPRNMKQIYNLAQKNKFETIDIRDTEVDDVTVDEMLQIVKHMKMNPESLIKTSS
ncbi:uncharacterized protein [Clytia hemisphaerica]|uniref:uncharacterized protein isoform X2 n=1 Tax=Clytia hemisphaerica TaxID=252671 RepID=UPI0034D4743E